MKAKPEDDQKEKKQSFDIGYYTDKMQAFSPTDKDSFSSILKVAKQAINKIDTLIKNL